MCLYPRMIKNPKYKANKKNGGIIPPITDKRLLDIQIPCGQCMDCRKAKANAWRIRIIQELKSGEPAHMVTLTLDTENLRALTTTLTGKGFTYGYSLDNALGKLSVKRFRERWRRKYKKSPKHWLITELGQTGTEHLHLHGIIWTAHPERIKEQWGYGFVFVGQYVSERTANYCTKYFMKRDATHPSYVPIVLTSPGIGRRFIGSNDANHARYKGASTRQYMVTRTGHKIYLPKYYREKIYTDQQREQLWLNTIEKQTACVQGVEYSLSQEHHTYFRALTGARSKNHLLGYTPSDQNAKDRENIKRQTIQRQRLDNETTPG